MSNPLSFLLTLKMQEMINRKPPHVKNVVKKDVKNVVKKDVKKVVNINRYDDIELLLLLL
jgi:hypothetical protein